MHSVTEIEQFLAQDLQAYAKLRPDLNLPLRQFGFLPFLVLSNQLKGMVSFYFENELATGETESSKDSFPFLSQYFAGSKFLLATQRLHALKHSRHFYF